MHDDIHVEVGKCQDVGVEMSKEFAASSLLLPNNIIFFGLLLLGSSLFRSQVLYSLV